MTFSSSSSNDSSQLPKGLVGSGHQYSMGYGYGARVSTARNVQTLPASIPQYRYPPVSERSENLFRSRPMGLTGYKADKRLADQIVHQTSGDYGKFLIGVDSSDARLFMKPVPATLAMKKAKSLTASPSINDNNNNNNKSSTNNSVQSNSNDFNDSRELKSYREGGGSSSSSKDESMYQIQKTLKAIDFKAFPKHAKYNLRAAIQSPPSENQYRGVATNNQLGYKNCLNWSGQLRS